MIANAANGWVRRVRVENADTALFLTSTDFVTVSGAWAGVTAVFVSSVSSVADWRVAGRVCAAALTSLGEVDA